MVNLHYKNLPDLNFPSNLLMKHVYFGLGDYRAFIQISLNSLWSPNRLLKVSWKVTNPDPPERVSSRELASSRAVPTPTWILMEETETSEDVDVVEKFCDAVGESVIESPERGAPRIRVLDSDWNRGALLLEREPTKEQKILYLPPSDYVLRQQLKALTRLRDRPEPEHRGLLRLVEESQKVRWPNVELVSPEDWEFLTDPEVEGTDEQRNFVRIALGTPDFAVLEGPPGSGKTTTICELISQEVRRGHRVMLCASTHVAVDNVLETLQEHGATSAEIVAVRIGDQRRISEGVKDFQLQERAKKEWKDLIVRLERLTSRTMAQQYLLDALRGSADPEGGIMARLILESANLVCGTTVGILQHPDIKALNIKRKWNEPREEDQEGERVVRPFDCLILDEASKTTFQEFLVPALFSGRWILVGDVNQLSPYIETTSIEDNLKGIIKTEADARVCLNVFQSWEGSRHKTQGMLILDTPDAANYVTQAKSLGLNALDLTQAQEESSSLEVLAAHVILSHKEKLNAIQDRVPPDITTFPPESATPEMNRRHAYWLQHNSWATLSPQTVDVLSEWACNIGWRLARSFEQRGDATAEKLTDEAIRSLLPRWYSQEDLSRLQFSLEVVKRIALPSFLELLQKGFGRREGASKGSTVTDGMDIGAFSERHVRLSYQHRMHPDISLFPRDFVYRSESLKDPHTLASRRTWGYGRYLARSGWIQTVATRAEPENMNTIEAEIIMRELDEFLRWAAGHLKTTDNSRRPWEIAILTFYRKQESLLRKHLQQRFGWKFRSEFRSADGSVRIRLCTVDRFQGHEADIVILSFVRNRGIGFLDSPNRLNVAITRARYQIVLVGNQKRFAGLRRDTLLKKLAVATPTLGVAWGERR